MGARHPDIPRVDRSRLPVNAYLKSVVRSFKAALVSVFVFSFFVNLLSLAVPLYLLQIYSKVLAGRNVDTLIFLTIIVLAAVLALGLLEWIRRAVLMKLGLAFEASVSEHLLNSAIHRSVQRQEPSVNVMRDLSELRNFLGGSALFPILDAPWTPLFILILYLLHPWLGLIGLGGACAMLSLALLNEYVTREPLRAASVESRQMLDHARAYVRNADVVQAMGMQASVLPDWRSRNADTLSSSYRAARISTRLQSLSKLVRLCLQIGIICVAAWLIMQHQLTAGATIASVLLMRRAIAPLEQSIRSWKSVLSARSSFRNVSEYLNHASSIETPRVMPVPEGTLMADGVSFRTAADDRSIFSRVNLTLIAGKITALVGPTAAGKSTLLRVMAGIAKPTSGEVTLGGFDLQQWAPEQLGPHFGYLPQRVSLLPGTVRENISRLQEAPVEKVIEAARLANVHEMIQRLPEGYETRVLEDGLNLSAGQQQRIGLARAVFGNPGQVLLDEPDANLDAASRSLLRKALRNMRDSGMALLIITHHASLEKVADRVYRLENRKLHLERSEKSGTPTRSVVSLEKAPRIVELADHSTIEMSGQEALQHRSVAGGSPRSEWQSSVTWLQAIPAQHAAALRSQARQPGSPGSVSTSVTDPEVQRLPAPMAESQRSEEPDDMPVVETVVAAPVPEPTRDVASDPDLLCGTRSLSTSETRMLRKLQRRSQAKARRTKT